MSDMTADGCNVGAWPVRLAARRVRQLCVDLASSRSHCVCDRRRAAAFVRRPALHLAMSLRGRRCMTFTKILCPVDFSPAERQLQDA
jgi:hypothetical protein